MGVEDIHVVEEQSALLRVAMLVARETPLEPLFTRVAEESARVLGVDATGVMRYLGGERAVVAGVWVVPGQRYLPVNAELDFHRADSALGRAQTTGLPARFARYDAPRNELSQAMRHLGMRTSIAVPVVAHDVIWGALVATAADEESLPAGSEHRLTPVAELLGQRLRTAPKRAELAESRTRLIEAGDETRRRLERNLHEGAHQHVVALALKLRVARSRAIPGSDDEAVLADVLADAMEASAALGELARGLHPAVLSERGLAAALQVLVARAPVPTHLRELPGRRFSAVIETTVYLLVAEAFGNAASHSHATECMLRVADGG